MRNFSELKKELLRDPATLAAYKASEPKYRLIRQVIQKRIDQGLTQGQLAKKIGTKQSAISRFEGGISVPTLSFLQKLARALNADLKVSFK